MNDIGINAGPDFIEFPCPKCTTRLKVGLALVGKPAKCPKCASVAQVPTPQSQPAASPVQSMVTPQLAPSNDLMPPGGTAAPPPPQPAVPEVAPQVVPDMSSPAPAQPQMPAQPEIGADTPARQLYKKITTEVAKVFVGQDELVQGALVALFSGGHVMIESVPGLGKTLFVRTLGKILGCDFGRIQFTADLMPSDITGSPIFNMKSQEFEFRPGPIFTQMLLADEINRSPAKTHAALLEIMQEKRVTVDGTSHELELPFLVVATQNPIESEGTYNLPEAQLDRFMFKLIADYPSEEQEAKILQMHGGQEDLTSRLEEEVLKVTSPAEINEMTRNNASVRIDPLLVNYINKIVRLTRQWPQFYMGASPRAGISLMQGARTLAAFYGRDYAVPDDVVQIALPTLRHRVQLTAEAEVEGQDVDQLLSELIRTVEVPRLR